MSLTEAQKKAIEDSNNFDWNNAQPINAGQGALTSNCLLYTSDAADE